MSGAFDLVSTTSHGILKKTGLTSHGDVTLIPKRFPRSMDSILKCGKILGKNSVFLWIPNSVILRDPPVNCGLALTLTGFYVIQDATILCAYGYSEVEIVQLNVQHEFNLKSESEVMVVTNSSWPLHIQISQENEKLIFLRIFNRLLSMQKNAQ